ncbi:MAG: hypothetical protein QM529_03300 [Hydrotalea sp.]|nr:hypothetical protein [Hydrotalea sp.]
MQSIINQLPTDPTLWVAVSFGIFVILAFVKGRGMLLGMLDKNIADVKNQLAEAARIKKEAEEFYHTAEKKLQDAKKMADEILQGSRDDAKKILADADEKLQKQLAQKEKQLANRLVQDQAKLKDQLVKEIAQEAIASARDSIARELANEKNNDNLLEKSIKKLGGLQ